MRRDLSLSPESCWDHNAENAVSARCERYPIMEPSPELPHSGRMSGSRELEGTR